MKNQRLKKRLLSSLLAMGMFVSGCYIPSATVGRAAVAEKSTVENTLEKTEIKSERTEDSTTYQLSNGKKETTIYGEPVRYTDEETGELKDYDASLKKTDDKEGYRYQNKQGDKTNYLPEVLQEDTPVQTTSDKYQMSLVPDETQTEVCEAQKEEVTDLYGETEKKTTTVRYEGNDEKRSYEYRSQSNGIKESIVLTEKPETNTFTSIFTLKNSYAALKSKGKKKIPQEVQTASGQAVRIYDQENNHLVGEIPAAYVMDDSQKAFSEDCSYQLTKIAEDNKEKSVTYRLTLTVSSDYFEQKNLSYPVVVDPTMVWTCDTNMDFAVVRDKDCANTVINSTSRLLAGREKYGNYCTRTYVHFDGLADKLKGKYISTAKLLLTEQTGCDSGVKVGAYPLQSSWSGTTLTYANQPESMVEMMGSGTTLGEDENVCEINLRGYMLAIKQSGYTDRGLMLCSSKESDTSVLKCARFYGKTTYAPEYDPSFQIVYSDVPTAPTSLTLGNSYIKKGSNTTLSWSGISSASIGNVYCKVYPYNESTKTVGAENTSYRTTLKTAASGTSTLNCSTWAEGCYQLKVYANDTQSNTGAAKTTLLHIDSTAPTLGSASVTTENGATTSSTAYSKECPKIAWSGASDTHFSRVEYSVNGGSTYKTAGTTESGSYTIPASVMPGSGVCTINVRSVDQSGNTSAVKSLSYYYDITAPVISVFSLLPETTVGNPANQIPSIKFTVSDNISLGTSSKTSPLQYSVNGGNYATMRNLSGTSKSGTAETMTLHYDTTRTYSISLRCYDSAGNVSTVKTLPYYYKSNEDTANAYRPEDVIISETEGKTTISWKKKYDTTLPDTIRYTLYRSTSSDFTPSSQTVVNSLIDENHYTVYNDDSTDGTKYYYKVCAKRFDESGIQAVSTYATASSTTEGSAELSRNLGTGSPAGYFAATLPAGSAQIERQQGNLNYTGSGISLSAGNLSLQVTPVYNSASHRDTTMGYGWSLPSDQNITSNGSNLIYLDESGMRHTFVPSGTVYKCEDMSGTSLEKKNGTKKVSWETTSETVTYAYYMTTDQTVSYFDSFGTLILETESNGSFLRYRRDSDHDLLTEVITATGRKVTFTYDKSTTTAKARLIQACINSDGGKTQTISFQYTSDQLTTIKDSGFINTADTTQDVTPVKTYFTYTGSQLTKVRGANQLGYDLTYTGSAIHKITDPIGEYKTYELTGNTAKANTYSTDAILVSTEEAALDGEDRVTSETDVKGQTTAYQYTDSSNPYDATVTTQETVTENIDNQGVKVSEGETTTTSSYSSEGNLLTETDVSGNTTSYAYTDAANPDSPTKVTQTEQGTGNVVSNQTTVYDAKGNETRTSDTIQETVTANTYEAGNCTGSETSVQDKTSSNTQSSYDAEGNAIQETTVSGTTQSTTKTTYDEMNHPLKETNIQTGVVTEYTYDAFGRVIKTETTYPASQGAESSKEIETKVYDIMGNVIQEKSKDGTVTTTNYDSLGRITEQITSKNGKSKVQNYQYTYSTITISGGSGIEKTIQNTAVQTVTNQNGTLVSRQYKDTAGNVVRSYSGGIYTDYLYDDAGHAYVTVVRGTSLNGTTDKVTVQLYDASSNVTDTIQNPDIVNGTYQIGTNSIHTSSTYDSLGNTLTETDAKGNVTSYIYSEDKKLLSVTQADGTGNAYQYSVASGDNFKDITTNARGYESITLNNAAGQCLSQTDEGEAGENITTSYTYDSTGNKIKETYGTGAYETYTYDKKNQLSVKTQYQSDGTQEGKTVYTYDINGNITKTVDYAIKNNAFVPLRTTQSTYDDFGKLTAFVEVNGTATPTETEVLNNQLTYTYDIEDRLESVTYPVTSGVEKTTYDYNTSGWLTSVNAVVPSGTTKTTKTLRSYRYDAMGKVSSIQDHQDVLTDGTDTLTKTYLYDELERVSQMTTKKSSSENVLQSDAYTYDKNGNILTKAEEKHGATTSTTYEYNTVNRLTKSVKTKASDTTTTRYQYDETGNRTRMYVNGTSTSYVYNGLNQLASQTKGTSTKYYTYDGAGNQVSETEGNTQRTYTYDVKNQLTKVQETAGDTTKILQTNAYNGEGQRIQKTENGTSTNYYYQNGSMYRTTDAAENVESLYLYGSVGNAIAVEDFTKDAVIEYTYVKDVQGSTCQLLDDMGAMVSEYDYDDYGTTTMTGADTVNVLAYTGGVYDDETGQYYLNARYYDPEQGDFLTQDSYRGEQKQPETWNLYGYCGGNPVNYVDPSGHDAIWLQVTNGVCIGKKYMGHTGLLIEKNRLIWKYLSFSKSGIRGGNVLIWRKKENNNQLATKLMNLVNYNYRRPKKDTLYNRFIYFAGRFGEHPEINNRYAPLSNNCMQRTAQILRKGVFARNNWTYQFRLLQSISVIVPNKAYDIMRK